MQKLLALCLSLVAVTLLYVSPLRLIGFILGTLLHGPLFLRRQFRSSPAFFFVWLVAFCAFTLVLAGALLVHFPWFIVGLLPYGYFYWDSTERTGARQSSFLRKHPFWQSVRASLGHAIYASKTLNDERNAGTMLLVAFHAPGDTFGLALFLTFMVDNPVIQRFFNAPPLIAMDPIWLSLPLIRDFLLAMGAVDGDHERVLKPLLLHGRRHVVVVCKDDFAHLATAFSAGLRADGKQHRIAIAVCAAIIKPLRELRNGSAPWRHFWGQTDRRAVFTVLSRVLQPRYKRSHETPQKRTFETLEAFTARYKEALAALQQWALFQRKFMQEMDVYYH